VCDRRGRKEKGADRAVAGAQLDDQRTQPERDMNCEGRKRAEKGQKIADGTKGTSDFFCDIKMIGWLGNLDLNQD
jgi:hypothetical protein